MPLSQIEAIKQEIHNYEEKYVQFLDPNYQPNAEETEAHKEYVALKRELDRAYYAAAFKQFLDKANEDRTVTERILPETDLGPVPDNLQIPAAKSPAKAGKIKRQKPKKTQSLSKRQRARNWHNSSPDVLRRRQIVLKNPRMPTKTLCKVFDNAAPPIPLPNGWLEELNVKSWSEAYKKKKTQNRIHKLVSTDRHSE